MGVSSYLVTAIAVTGAFALPASEPATSLSNFVTRAQAVNFNQDYIAGGANVQYTPNQGAGSFSVTYNTNADFVVGLGWQPGDGK
jgi:endo-1,4-beta-xylanase